MKIQATNNFSIKHSAATFKVLSSSLYENKPLSVLQEIASNAYDANKVISQENPKPIIIQLTQELLTITDQGLGMDKEQLTNLYTTYFSSTKEEDKNSIGGFGLGSKSPFAISDTFDVTSVTKGYITSIICYKDGSGTPSVSVVAYKENLGQIPRGTKVSVPLSKKTYHDMLDATDNGLFNYWEIPPTFENSQMNRYAVKALNDKQLFKFNNYNYLYNSDSDIRKVLVGEYTYKIPETLLTSKEINYLIHQEFKEIPITSSDKSGLFAKVLLSFDLEELELAPSRERIESTEANKQVVLTAFKAYLSNVHQEFRATVEVFEGNYLVASKEDEIITLSKELKALRYLISQVILGGLTTWSNPSRYFLETLTDYYLGNLTFKLTIKGSLGQEELRSPSLNVISEYLEEEWEKVRSLGVTNYIKKTWQGNYKVKKLSYTSSNSLTCVFVKPKGVMNSKMKAAIYSQTNEGNNYLMLSTKEQIEAFHTHIKDNYGTVGQFENCYNLKFIEIDYQAEKVSRVKADDPVLGDSRYLTGDVVKYQNSRKSDISKEVATNCLTIYITGTKKADAYALLLAKARFLQYLNIDTNLVVLNSVSTIKTEWFKNREKTAQSIVVDSADVVNEYDNMVNICIVRLLGKEVCRNLFRGYLLDKLLASKHNLKVEEFFENSAQVTIKDYIFQYSNLIKNLLDGRQKLEHGQTVMKYREIFYLSLLEDCPMTLSNINNEPRFGSPAVQLPIGFLDKQRELVAKELCKAKIIKKFNKLTSLKALGLSKIS